MTWRFVTLCAYMLPFEADVDASYIGVCSSSRSDRALAEAAAVQAAEKLDASPGFPLPGAHLADATNSTERKTSPKSTNHSTYIYTVHRKLLLQRRGERRATINEVLGSLQTLRHRRMYVSVL